MRIRKQVYDLTLDDMNEFPIWEFVHGDGQEEDGDEATVRPALVKLDDVERMCVAQACFTLADGSIMKGYASPGDIGSLGHIQPTILANGEQVPFWHGIRKPDQQWLAMAYQHLGKRPDEVFPITFALDVRTDRPVAGTIPGFQFLNGAEFEMTEAIC